MGKAAESFSNSDTAVRAVCFLPFRFDFIELSLSGVGMVGCL